MLVLLHIASQKSFKLCVLCSWILVTSGVIFGHVRSMRPGLTAGALGPSIVSLNTNKSSSSSPPTASHHHSPVTVQTLVLTVQSLRSSIVTSRSAWLSACTEASSFTTMRNARARRIIDAGRELYEDYCKDDGP